MNFAAFNNFKFAYDAVSATWEKNDKSRYKSLEELYKINGPDKVYEGKAIWIRNAKTDENGNITDGSMYKENPVVTIEGLFANIPHHQLKQVQAMLNSDTIIDEVDDGHFGFTIREYDNKYKPGEKAYAANWCDIGA